MAMLFRSRLCSLFLLPFGFKSATGSDRGAGFNAPHRTGLVDFPHPALPSISGNDAGQSNLCTIRGFGSGYLARYAFNCFQVNDLHCPRRLSHLARSRLAW